MNCFNIQNNLTHKRSKNFITVKHRRNVNKKDVVLSKKL